MNVKEASARHFAELVFGYNAQSALGIEDETRADRALACIQGQRLTYKRNAA